MSNAIRTEKNFSALTVREVRNSEFQKEGTSTAILEQVVKTTSYYPGKKISNEFQDNIYSPADVGADEQQFTVKETRIAFLLVPAGTTKEQVTEQLKKYPKANIYRILSSKPIVSKDQMWQIENKNLTIKQLEDRQKVVDSDSGEILTDANGQEMFRCTFFSAVGKADIDLREKLNITPEHVNDEAVASAISEVASFDS